MRICQVRALLVQGKNLGTWLKISGRFLDLKGTLNTKFLSFGVISHGLSIIPHTSNG
jgi:hypothetical protein